MWQWYFTHMPRHPNGTIILNFGMWGDIADVIIHPRQILCWSVQGLWSFDTPYFHILHRLSWLPLQQCRHYHATLWWYITTRNHASLDNFGNSEGLLYPPFLPIMAKFRILECYSLKCSYVRKFFFRTQVLRFCACAIHYRFANISYVRAARDDRIVGVVDECKGQSL